MSTHALPEASNHEPVARLRHIDKIYGTRIQTQVLFDINLEILPGEFAAIVGASGSGKTTLLNILGLLDNPSNGEVWLGAGDTATLPEDSRAALRRDYLGFIFQFHYLLPEFTVLENALMPCMLQGPESMAANRARMIALLEEVGMADHLHYRPSQLSGGQQQRVAIIRALANDPLLVLADEPTGNLDSKTGHAVFDLMQQLCEQTGKAFLMVTHDEHFAAATQRQIQLLDGRIVSA